jgi:tRNA(adenine34) deaminase
MMAGWTPQDEQAMRIALDQAHNAWLVGEVPVGAVVMRNGQVIATGYNRPVTTHDPTAHAELVALRHAAQLLENYRLPECELFVTLEPCAMCAMALMHARFKRVVFGATDPKTGAAGSVLNLFAQSALNHQTECVGGLLGDACGQILRDFFAERRAQQKAERIGKVLVVDELGSAERQEPEIPSGEATEWHGEPAWAGRAEEGLPAPPDPFEPFDPFTHSNPPESTIAPEPPKPGPPIRE